MQNTSSLPLTVSYLCSQLMFLAYLFFLVWLGVTAFTSLPVFMYFNVWSMCQNTSLVEGANLCLDLRQFGMDHDNTFTSETDGWMCHFYLSHTFNNNIKYVL